MDPSHLNIRNHANSGRGRIYTTNSTWQGQLVNASQTLVSSMNIIIHRDHSNLPLLYRIEHDTVRMFEICGWEIIQCEECADFIRLAKRAQ
jgi:hypothetical protein